MPQLGPKFLHRPIALPKSDALEGLLGWLAEGAVSLLPPKVRNARWRPAARLVAYEGNGLMSDLGVIERSWIGATRLGNVPNGAKLPAVVALDLLHIFETSASFPAAANESLNRAVELRMAELSPIPPEEAVFAIGERQKKDGRVIAKIAIAKKAILADIGANVQASSIVAIGARPCSGGSLTYTFSKQSDLNRAHLTKWLATGLALWAAIIIVLGSWQDRQSRALGRMELHQAELRGELKSVRAAGDYAERLRALSASLVSIESADQAIEREISALPAGVVLDALILEKDMLHASGLAPRGETSPTNDALNRSPSDYPGFDRFTLTTPLSVEDGTQAKS